jgi:hypothetical protein
MGSFLCAVVASCLVGSAANDWRAGLGLFLALLSVNQMLAGMADELAETRRPSDGGPGFAQRAGRPTDDPARTMTARKVLR